MADRSGRAVLVEFYGEEMALLPNEGPWHQATNFLQAAVTFDKVSAGPAAATGYCARYDRIYTAMAAADGQLATQEALDLLASVAQSNTQWSIVYGLETGQVSVIMGREWDDVESFRLGMDRP